MDDFPRIYLRKLFSVSQIRTILYYEFPKDYYFPGERHNFWEFIYVDKGEVVIASNTNEYLLKAGELAFHQPNEFHNVRADGFIAPNVAVISFDCSSAQMRYFENKILFLNDREKRLLSEILREGGNAFEKMSEKPPIKGMRRKKKQPPGAEQLVKISLESLLISIYRRRDVIFKRERYLKSSQQHAYARITADILHLLRQHVTDELDLSEISSTLGVSVSQIKKVFKSQTGRSVMAYFIEMKIEEAKRLIREENLNFTQISDHLGYGSVHYFSRTFKMKTGMTPTEYSLSVKM